MIYYIAILLCGIIFGCGLTISNMINAVKVQNFLDITGNWDPSLALVMGSALFVTWIGYKFVLRLKHPQLAEKFLLPNKTAIDRQLIVGAAIFGIGWGCVGYCPGPAITALGLGIQEAIYFILGMASGTLFLWLLSLRRKTPIQL